MTTQHHTSFTKTISESISLTDISIEHPMKEHVHFADGPCIQVHLLTIQGQVLWVFSVLDQIVSGLDQHTT